MDCLGSCDDFLVSGIQLSIGDIFTDSACKQEIVLRHNAHLLPETLNADALDIMPVNPDNPFLDIIKTADEVDNGCFSGASRSHEGNCLTWLDVEAHIIENVCVFVIGESNMFKVYCTDNFRHLCHAVGVHDFRASVENLKDSLCAGNVCNQLVIKVAQVHDWLPEHGNIGAKCNKGTH